MNAKSLREIVEDWNPKERIDFMVSHGNYNLSVFDREWLENALMDWWEGNLCPNCETINEYDEIWQNEKDRLSHLSDEMLIYEGGDSGVFE